MKEYAKLLSLLFFLVVTLSCNLTPVSVTQNNKETSNSCLANQTLINSVCYDTCSVTHPCAFGFVCDVYSSPMICKSSSNNINKNSNKNNTFNDDSDNIADSSVLDEAGLSWQSPDVSDSDNINSNQNNTNNSNQDNDNYQPPISQNPMKVSNSKLGFHVLGNANLPSMIIILKP